MLEGLYAIQQQEGQQEGQFMYPAGSLTPSPGLCPPPCRT
jgi:hypothetical protein